MSSSKNFDILRLMSEAYGSSSKSGTTEETTKKSEGPICQTLSYFDVIYPHLQMACSRTVGGGNQTNKPSTSIDERTQENPLEFGNFCKVIFKQMNKSKRTRTSFTTEQLEGLEQCFKESHYVTSTDRKIIAERLGVTETQVKVWFQNRRTKHKRVTNGEEVDDDDDDQEMADDS